jgi:uncharacterized integral membrane protein
VKIATIAVLVLLAALSLFALLNWGSIVAPTTLSLGFTTAQAPLGLVLLAGFGLLTATFLVFATYQQATALVEARRFARDLHAQRTVADKAEASRFTDLRAYLEAELGALSERVATSQAETQARLGRLEEALVARLGEVTNGLAAHLGEVEDKIDRSLKAS